MKTYLLLTAALVLSTQGASAAETYSTAVDLIDSFEKVFNVNPGKRRNHTKGFCFEGRIVPHGTAVQKYSSSDLFVNDSRVIGRLSHKGGKLTPADNKLADYGLSLAIKGSDDDQYMMSMNTEDFSQFQHLKNLLI